MQEQTERPEQTPPPPQPTIQNEIASLETELLSAKDALDDIRAKNPIYFFKPWVSPRIGVPYQQMLIDAFHSGKSVMVFDGPNKLGKTEVGSGIVISWCLGYEPWVWIKDGKRKYGPSSLGIKPPVKIRITGEDWTHHIGSMIVPALKRLIPKALLESTKKNHMGVDYFFKFKNGSTIEIMTHDQDESLFESWLGHGWWADEPPKEKLYAAMMRGLFMTGGKTLLTMTPLKEAWILDRLVQSGLPYVGSIGQGLNTYDNPIVYENDKNQLESIGLGSIAIANAFFDESVNNATASNQERTREIIDFLVNHLMSRDAALTQESAKSKVLGIYNDLMGEKFISSLTPTERKARVQGIWANLVGRVLEPFDHGKHIIHKPKPVRPDWPVTVMIDWHLSKPHAVSFIAALPDGFHHVVDELKQNGSAEDIADEIIRRKLSLGWRITRAFIDPLSRGDNKYMKNRADVEDSFKIMKRKLLPHKIMLDIPSKDQASGILNLNDWLAGPNGIPILYFYGHCKGHFHDLNRWVYDDTGKPKQEDDDFCENLYRYTLTGAKYTDPRAYQKAIDTRDESLI